MFCTARLARARSSAYPGYTVVSLVLLHRAGWHTRAEGAQYERDVRRTMGRGNRQ